MKTFAPDYYKEFRCTAGKCKNTCCAGWEIDIDEETLGMYEKYPEIAENISYEGTAHFKLKNDRCPFLCSDGLCMLIKDHGEGFLCRICADHPRFRNFWTGRTEIGLGLVCEEAARIILLRDKPMKFEIIDDDGNDEDLPEDEKWLMDIREKLIAGISGNGPEARLLEYLFYRHIPDALYDDRLEERIGFIREIYDEILDDWEKTDRSPEALIECARRVSYDKEYVE